MSIFPYGIEPSLNYSSIHILNPSPRRVSRWMEASLAKYRRKLYITLLRLSSLQRTPLQTVSFSPHCSSLW